MKPLNCGLLLLILVFSHDVFALRCGRYVINAGMYKNEIRNKCGEPDSVETHFATKSYGNSIEDRQGYGNPGNYYPRSSVELGQYYGESEETVIEEWIYNFGSSRLQQYLRFENGRLQEIRNLNRGYRVK